MADKTAIAWTDHTFNPWMGCHKVSQGCKHCYAETLTKNRMGLEVFGANGLLRRRTGKAVWARPRRWNDSAALGEPGARGVGPHMVFIASLADVFEDAPGPNEWREDVWKVIHDHPWLDFQLLTKRPENIERMLPEDWADNRWGYWPNVWLGTSIEDNRVVERGPILTGVPAVVHFVSYEPAIGPLDQLGLDGLQWMIVGGESGPGYRPMDLEWVRDMRRRCEAAGVAFFFKQSAAPRTEMGIELDGEIVRNYPPAWDRAELPAKAA